MRQPDLIAISGFAGFKILWFGGNVKINLHGPFLEGGRWREKERRKERGKAGRREGGRERGGKEKKERREKEKLYIGEKLRS